MSTALRGIIDTLRGFDEEFRQHVNDNEAEYNLLLTITGDLIPVVFQLSTMIFGYIKYRNDKRNKLEVQNNTEQS